MKFISLFSGCGGSSLGYTQAGFRSIVAVDINPLACETYLLNFPDTKVLNSDITQINPIDLIKDQNLSVGELDLLDSSPPCQGFSIAGKRDPRDIRNELFFYVK
jgi:DNA (cytosine-5)-methyltransferase 1